MSRVHLDIADELVAALMPNPDAARQAAATLAHLARAEIIRLAKERLHSTERDYTGGVLPVQVWGVTAFIVLDGVLPNMVENGWAGGDMRQWMLKSPKARISKAGHRYLIIPFRFMLPGATGRNAPAVGAAYENAPIAMNKLIAEGLRRIVAPKLQKLTATRVQVSLNDDGALERKTTWGGSLPAAEAGPKMRPRHASPIMAGTYRFGRSYSAGISQSQYGTFRVISDSPSTKRADFGGQNWTHPGIPARHLFLAAADYTRKIAPAVVAGVIHHGSRT